MKNIKKTNQMNSDKAINEIEDCRVAFDHTHNVFVAQYYMDKEKKTPNRKK